MKCFNCGYENQTNHPICPNCNAKYSLASVLEWMIREKGESVFSQPRTIKSCVADLCRDDSYDSVVFDGLINQGFAKKVSDLSKSADFDKNLISYCESLSATFNLNKINYIADAFYLAITGEVLQRSVNIPPVNKPVQTITDFVKNNKIAVKILVGSILGLIVLISFISVIGQTVRSHKQNTNSVAITEANDFSNNKITDNTKNNSGSSDDTDLNNDYSSNNDSSSNASTTISTDAAITTTHSETSGENASLIDTPSTTAHASEAKTTSVVGSSISGTFSAEDEKIIYTYKAPVYGKYRFDLDIDNVNYSYSISIKDSKNAKLSSGSSGSSSKGITVTLEKDYTYTIEIIQDYGLCSYSISIGVPNTPKTVSGTEISGSITYTDQSDTYYYTANVDGYYRFDLDISNVNNNYRFSIYDSKEQKLASCSYSDFGHGTNAKLKANEKYRIVIVQDYRLCDYKITIGVPTEPTQVAGNSILGSLSFEEQKDTYYYTAPRTGRYIFKLSSGNVNANYNFEIIRANNSKIRSTTYYAEKNKNTLVNLNENENYTITISQDYLLSSYEIAITPPSPPISISGNSFSGSIEYKDQYITYQFSVNKSGTYSFDFDQLSLDFVLTTEIQECSTGNSVKTGRIYRGSESFYARLEAGKQYYLKVFYESYLKSFSGSINFYKE